MGGEGIKQNTVTLQAAARTEKPAKWCVKEKVGRDRGNGWEKERSRSAKGKPGRKNL